MIICEIEWLRHPVPSFSFSLINKEGTKMRILSPNWFKDDKTGEIKEIKEMIDFAKSLGIPFEFDELTKCLYEDLVDGDTKWSRFCNKQKEILKGK